VDVLDDVVQGAPGYDFLPLLLSALYWRGDMRVTLKGGTCNMIGQMEFVNTARKIRRHQARQQELFVESLHTPPEPAPPPVKEPPGEPEDPHVPLRDPDSDPVGPAQI
jgi:hypothetical protein